MKKILILFAHPALQRSRINKKLLKEIENIEGVTVNDLYEEYPDLHIDVKREQDLLLDHDVIIFQHPFYWYSTPAMLKEWQDMVLQHGWAYGHEGRMLAGKTMLNAISTGGPEKAYQSGGYNRFTIRQLLAPMEQTAKLCKMHYLGPFVIHGTHLIDPDSLKTHVQDYQNLLEALIHDKIDLDKAGESERINSDMAGLMKGAKDVR